MQAFAEFAYLSLIKGHCNDIITIWEASEMVTVEEDRDGYANQYLLDLQGLNVLDLSQKGFTTLHWITLLLQNRVFTLKNDIIKAGKRYLVEHFSLPVHTYDVLKGYRADDSYFAYAESFLNNTISVQRLSEALKLGNLGEQVVLMSQKSFGQLRFLGYEAADAATYYPLRKARNEQARMEFLSNRRGVLSPDDLYLADIIRGGIKPDDPRLQ
ncbi:MAG TPA: DUF3990 domain-containing protein [Candidatus Gallimonas intestinavium]|uniref:DUF3990 domain-containing protein n=1 Tax=Candidatus Gallimonas intestinavium TaxID=2838603 RepID=A0A9D2JZV4_9FIRM|nr:DUF3990 domain-containing protein [Candidatus Gallimonas intestinavium]